MIRLENFLSGLHSPQLEAYVEVGEREKIVEQSVRHVLQASRITGTVLGVDPLEAAHRQEDMMYCMTSLFNLSPEVARNEIVIADEFLTELADEITNPKEEGKKPKHPGDPETLLQMIYRSFSPGETTSYLSALIGTSIMNESFIRLRKRITKPDRRRFKDKDVDQSNMDVLPIASDQQMDVAELLADLSPKAAGIAKRIIEGESIEEIRHEPSGISQQDFAKAIDEIALLFDKSSEDIEITESDAQEAISEENESLNESLFTELRRKYNMKTVADFFAFIQSAMPVHEGLTNEEYRDLASLYRWVGVYKMDEGKRVFNVNDHTNIVLNIRNILNNFLALSKRPKISKQYSLATIDTILTREAERLGYGERIVLPKNVNDMIRAIREMLPEGWEKSLDYVLRINITERWVRVALQRMLIDRTNGSNFHAYIKKLTADIPLPPFKREHDISVKMRSYIEDWYVHLKDPYFFEHPTSKTKRNILLIGTALAEDPRYFSKHFSPEQQQLWMQIRQFIEERGYWSRKEFLAFSNRNGIKLASETQKMYDLLYEYASLPDALRRRAMDPLRRALIIRGGDMTVEQIATNWYGNRVTRQAVSNFETSKSNPYVETIYKYLYAVGNRSFEDIKQFWQEVLTAYDTSTEKPINYFEGADVVGGFVPIARLNLVRFEQFLQVLLTAPPQERLNLIAQAKRMYTPELKTRRGPQALKPLSDDDEVAFW